MLVDTHRQVGQGRKRHIDDTRVHALAWRTFRLPIAHGRKGHGLHHGADAPRRSYATGGLSGVITVSVVSQLDSSYRSMSKHTRIESWESASIKHKVVSSSITHNTIDGTTRLAQVTCGFVYCVYILWRSLLSPHLRPLRPLLLSPHLRPLLLSPSESAPLSKTNDGLTCRNNRERTHYVTLSRWGAL